jgi:uncharacterized delta-60 repeat protein
LERRQLMSGIAAHPCWHRAGALDPGFANGGTIDATLIARLPDGVLLVSQGPTWEKIDTSGAVLGSLPNPARPSSTFFYGAHFTLDPAGRVLLFGDEGPGHSSGPVIVRQDLNGSPDPSFGSGGTVAVPTGLNSLDYGSIAFQPDGKLLVFNEEVSTPQFQFARLNEDGSVDASFNHGAVETWSETNEPKNDGINIAPEYVQPDGKILIYAELEIRPASNSGMYTYRPLLLRFNPDGSPDLTFGSDGQVLLSDRLTWAGNVVVRADGKLDVSAGNAKSGIVEQLNPDGSLDNSFGKHGQAVVTFLPGGHYFSQQLTVDQAGRILVAGVQQFGQPGGGGRRLPLSLRKGFCWRAANEFVWLARKCVWQSRSCGSVGWFHLQCVANSNNIRPLG